MSRRDYLKHLGFNQSKTTIAMPTERQTDVIMESELEFKTFKKEPMNNTPIEIPVEVVESIKTEAHQIFPLIGDVKKRIGYIAGATAYASKLLLSEERNSILLDEMSNLSKLLQEKDTRLQAAEQEIESLTNQLKKQNEVQVENLMLLRKENEKLKEQATGWRPLLEEFISMHETGLLPNRFTYEKAKKFINGE